MGYLRYNDDGEEEYDPFGDKEVERQYYESPNDTNYRHWQEQNAYNKKHGYPPVEYKPLDDWWDPDTDELNH